ncbi:MAG: sugar phosphate isomerase/epimerase [Clostridia bacterium]|nr:sugar phosphate isomerase/epimerase [Clostridia bacterium]
MAKIRLAAFSDEAATSIQGQIKELNNCGVYLTEPRFINGKNVADYNAKECKEFCKIFADGGIKVWSVGSPLGKVDINVNFNEYIETIKRVCENACALETNKIRVFSFYNAYTERQKVLDNLNKMVEVASSFNVELYHENEKEIYGDNLARVIDVLENVKGIKSVYDPANYIQVGEKSNDTLLALHNRSDYFHIKDVVEKTGELVPAGYGDGDINKLVGMIEKDTVLTLEPHLAVFDAFKQVDNTEMKHKFKFTSNVEAFAFAVKSLKELLVKNGYREINGEFVK